MTANTRNLHQVLKVNIDKGYIYLPASDIIFIRANNKHTIVSTVKGENTETHHLLKWYGKNLPMTVFCRCHDSFIVNLEFVECITGNQFRMNNGTFVPISNHRKSHAKECYKEFVINNSSH